jgi:type I restriction enzyme S subunit
MREGYKDSELGEIPKSWEVLKLSEFTDEVTDYVAAGSFASLKDNVNVFSEPNHAIYVRLTDLRKGLGHLEQKYVDEGSYNFLSKSNLFGREILFANIGANVGEVWMMPDFLDKATIAPNMIVIRANNKHVFPEYLHSYLCSSVGLRQIDKIIAGSGHPKVNKTELRQLSAILPPLKEQQKIAEILSTVDDKIELIDQQIAQTQSLKKGLMQRLLTKGIGHTEFKDSPLGEIPKSWEVVRLGDLFKLSSGSGLSKANAVEGEFPVYGGNGCAYYHNEFTHDKSELIIGRVGAKCGCIHRTLGKAWITDNALIVRTRLIDFNDLYIEYVLRKLDLNRFANKNAQPVISGGKIYPIQILLPSIEEQQEIAEILSSVDEKLEVLSEKKGQTQWLKKGLMQQLLTGRVRI